MKGFIITVAITVLVSGSYLFAQTAPSSDHEPGELLIMLKSKVSVDRVIFLMEQQANVEISAKKRLSQYLNLWLISFDEQLLSAEKYLEIARTTPFVDIAQLNHTNIERRNTPDDPLLNQQWPYQNTAAESAWNITTGGVTASGDTIVVAVIDEGFDLTHEDLVDNYFVNHAEIPGNNQDDDGNGFIDDRMGWDFYSNDPQLPLDNHGTHVSGTVGATGNNSTGVAGVNWSVKILPLAGSSTNEGIVVSSYAYAYDMRKRYNETSGAEGAYVVATNSSFGINFGQPFEYPIWCAMYDSLGAVGVLSAGATINSNVNVDDEGDIPTACESDFLISVTNTTASDARNNGAGYGVTTIDIGAPGTNVYSTLNNNGYGNRTGTSMATPHVAGAIALMYSALCEKTMQQFRYDPDGLASYIKDKLLTYGIDVIPPLQGQVASGGRLNLLKAVRSVSDSCLNAYVELTESSCGGCDGVAQALAFGGIPPYTYAWSTSAGSDSLETQLCAGIYSVTITDDIGQTKVLPFGVTDIGGPELTIATIDNSCPGESQGEASVLGGFNHSWSTGEIGTSISGLDAGMYHISGTDSLNQCTTVTVFAIHEPPPFYIDFDLELPSNGVAGSIEATVYGGTPPYALLWNTGSSDTRIDGLDFGIYTLSVLDANDCEYHQLAYLESPAGANEPRVITDLRIYPNPASEFIHITVNHSISAEISIYDQSGRLVLVHAFEESGSVIDVSGLGAGAYFLVLRTADHVLRKQLIVTGR